MHRNALLFPLTILFALLLGSGGARAEATFAAPSTASELDLMQGFPPPADKQITRRNFMDAPQNRWAFQRIRELQPTREIYRGAGPVAELAFKSVALDDLEVEISGGRRVSVSRWQREAYTDAMLVLHRGVIVYEKYLNGMAPHTQHVMFSVTKSFVGAMLLALIETGSVDPTLPVAHYVPELKKSAFGDATVQQVLDMTTAVAYSEVYDDPNSDIARYGHVFRIWGALPPDYDGPASLYEYLPTLKKKGEHGRAFIYVTPNTDVLAWILSRVTNLSVAEAMSTMLFQPTGAERDAYLWLDASGREMAGAGLNLTARDAARFAQMILQKGHYNGRQVLPAAAAERILQAGDPAPFNRYYQDPWHEQVAYAYHDQWWTFNNPHKAVSALGIHGQIIYIDPVAQMVVVKLSSDPEAESDINETDGPLVYHAIAEFLMKRNDVASRGN
jgi:CubicO group peptidase (beta-lactamase class C family)